jgi:hypothetical protein
MREGRVADPGQARCKSAVIRCPLCCRARTPRTTSKAVIVTNIKTQKREKQKGKKRKSAAKRRQNGGEPAAAVQRPPILPLAYFITNGKKVRPTRRQNGGEPATRMAGQILLILRRQQQNHNKQQHQARRAERTGPPYRIQNGFRQLERPSFLNQKAAFLKKTFNTTLQCRISRRIFWLVWKNYQFFRLAVNRKKGSNFFPE